MQLRDHAIMSYRGQKNWPPVWMWTGTGENKFPRGELGVLKEVYVSAVDPHSPDSHKPYNRVYLFIEYRDSRYVGALLFDDEATCRQIGKILLDRCGNSIADIGDIDLSHLL
jgi:hypothetical protein